MYGLNFILCLPSKIYVNNWNTLFRLSWHAQLVFRLSSLTYHASYFLLPVPLDRPIRGANSCGLSVNTSACFVNASWMTSYPFSLIMHEDPQYNLKWISNYELLLVSFTQNIMQLVRQLIDFFYYLIQI